MIVGDRYSLGCGDIKLPTRTGDLIPFVWIPELVCPPDARELRTAAPRPGLEGPRLEAFDTRGLLDGRGTKLSASRSLALSGAMDLITLGSAFGSGTPRGEPRARAELLVLPSFDASIRSTYKLKTNYHGKKKNL